MKYFLPLPIKEILFVIIIMVIAAMVVILPSMLANWEVNVWHRKLVEKMEKAEAEYRESNK